MNDLVNYISRDLVTFTSFTKQPLWNKRNFTTRLLVFSLPTWGKFDLECLQEALIGLENMFWLVDSAASKKSLYAPQEFVFSFLFDLINKMTF